MAKDELEVALVVGNIIRNQSESETNMVMEGQVKKKHLWSLEPNMRVSWEVSNPVPSNLVIQPGYEQD